MGYNTKAEMVEQGSELLSSILSSVEKGEELKLRVRDSNEISTEQYRLRRLLAATDNHPAAYGGKFARLGQRVLLRVDAERGLILVQPKGNINVETYKTNENDALSFLSEAKGSLTMLEFFPSSSFSLEDFLEAGKKIGWTIHSATFSKGENGKIELAAERIEETARESSGFDILS